MGDKGPVLFSYAFRPFFLLNGLFAIVAVVAWLMTVHGHGLATFSMLWHGHEMIVGFALAAVAGFSLTAVSVWTGRPALHGAPLAWLLLCWLLGRLAMAGAAGLPGFLVMTLDMLFPLLLCALLGREVFSAGNKRNFPLVFIIAVMAGLNGLYHLGSIEVVTGGERLAVHLMIHMVLLLVAIIGGRIIPSFTANWLRLQGQTELPSSNLPTDIAALSLTVLAGLAMTFWPVQTASGALAFAAAAVHGFRLSRWRGFATTANPLLFVLHAAYAWLPIGYALAGFAMFAWVFPVSTALHALTMGAIGSMVLAVTTRVSLGHTGRALRAARATVMAYWIMMIAVLMRILSTVIPGGYYVMIDLASAGWVAAFAIFTWVYWPILTGPRADAGSN